jgi:hypothetical protein
MAEVGPDGGPPTSEKRDVRERGEHFTGRRMSSKAGASFLSKWLERSPPMSYPRPWRGKLARIKGVDGLRPNPYRRALAMHWLFPS